MNIKECADALINEISKIYIGNTEKVRLLIMSIFAGGHILLDDIPGSGKTTLVKTLSKALGCSMGRIQFTPDLLPSDIIGSTIFNRNDSSFIQVKGPVFTNILLADEINRAIPRTQSALLEAMEEKQVTFDNNSCSLPEPFIVMATQNPVEKESTFALPAAQMDRFFIRLSLGFPCHDDEIQMLKKHGNRIELSAVNTITDAIKLTEITNSIYDIHVSDEIIEYIVSLIQKTRCNSDLKYGASPRASKSLFIGCKSYAAISGRNYVVPEDVQKIFIPILSHRIILSNSAKYSKKDAEDILNSILAETPIPPYKEDLFN